MLKTEGEIKRYLAKLTNDQIKKMVEGLDFSPFPILLTEEYGRRFGYGKKSRKNRKVILKNKIKKEKQTRRKVLRDLASDLKHIQSFTISFSGLDELSEKGISEIHNKTEALIKAFLQRSNTFAISTKRLVQLEKEYKSLN